jgi:hypothetical protein
MLPTLEETQVTLNTDELGHFIYMSQHRNFMFGRGYWQVVCDDEDRRYIMGGLAQARNLLWTERQMVEAGLATLIAPDDVRKVLGDELALFRIFKLTDLGEAERQEMLSGHRAVRVR